LLGLPSGVESPPLGAGAPPLAFKIPPFLKIDF